MRLPLCLFEFHVAAEQKAYDVTHPDFAMLTYKGRVLVVARTDAEAVHLISVPLITRVETNGAAP
jgi:hypothetical protein